MGIVADNWLPGEIASPAFYALIGMGTMMGATLHAPLAALTAMLELTNNPNIIMPGMLALITASLVSRELFGMESVYIELMRARGLDYSHSPLDQTLRRIGVASVMERKIEILPVSVGHERAADALASGPRWILVTEGNQPVDLMPAADLARHLKDDETAGDITLTEIPAKRREIRSIDFQSTLHEALLVLNRSNADALYVVRRTVPGINRVYGILTREDIDRSYSID